MKRESLLPALAALLLLIAAGCGSSTVVSGKVTYNGEPVENGSIEFLPEDGQGPTAGGMITGGQYRVEDLTPGKKIVQIVGVKTISFARTSEEMKQQAEAGAPVEKATQIPPNAEGNNVTVEVKPGAQTLDFQLKAPAPR